jgi:hypothetical protein
MKIYVNENYEILSLDVAPQKYVFCLDSSLARDQLFGNLCDICIQGYKYEPQYKLLLNDDGSNVRDEETGELLYKLDDNKEKILQGYACYPFMDYKTLMLIQKQYEDSQKKEKALTAKIEYLSMMTGVKTEVADE